jgi:hypothetical protein
MSESSKPVQILRGHVNKESAFVVDDYPYGFRLRCKIRYWLEHNSRGTRFVSQTTNPKVAVEVWNKPKASTYAVAPDLTVMFKDEQGHVNWTSVNGYAWPEHVQTFRDQVGALLNAEELARLDKIERFLRRLSPESWADWDTKQAAKKGN